MKKSKTRIFVNKSISSNLIIYIKDKQHHFLKNVLRIKVNDEINIFDGITGEWESTVMSINRENTVLRVTNIINKIKKSNDIWLVFSPIKQHRMSLAIQKATELGVSKIIPCITEFTNIRKINAKNLHDNAIEAAEQSERLDVPRIEKQVDLTTLLSNWPEDRKLIYCDEKIKEKRSIIDLLTLFKDDENKWAVLIGPEGGFSDSEQELITKSKNVLSVSLGDRLLRSDTAITVSLFCIQEILSK
ncbi:MAG TPA: 16S rRNA (uracil(1498)-N(3))-methyltransferase [Pelagibacterales bacterium]|nr:16S rRNA (uracil(1498)-N(3))-methyltransferase [Pelagibacterales bacterium]